VRELETLARITEPFEREDEDAQARAGDVVQIGEVQGGRSLHAIQGGLGELGLRRVQTARQLHHTSLLDLDLEHQRGNLLVRVMMALRSSYWYRMESQIPRTRRRP